MQFITFAMAILVGLVKVLDIFLSPTQKGKLRGGLDTLWCYLAEFNTKRLLMWFSGETGRAVALLAALLGSVLQHIVMFQVWRSTYSPPKIVILLLIFVIWGGLFVARWASGRGLYSLVFASHNVFVTLGRLLAVSLLGWCVFALCYWSLEYVPSVISAPSTAFGVRFVQGYILFIFFSALEGIVIVGYSCFFMFLVLLLGVCLVMIAKVLTTSLAFIVQRIADTPGGPIVGLSAILAALAGLFAAMQRD